MKRIRKLTTAFLVIALLVTSLVSVPALAEDDDYDKVIRLAGASRYLTAVEVSEEAYDEAETVIIAAGANFPDALAASALAGIEEAPILLAEKDGFRAGTLEEIARLGAKKAIVLGGEKALGEEVDALLVEAGLKVTRIAGENRYETAALIAEEVLDGGKEVFLVNGDEPWDALAIGPVAAREGIPVLLTKAGALRDETKAFLVDNGIKTVTILGGEKAVSAAARNQIPAGISVKRVYGANREETAIEIARTYFPELVATEPAPEKTVIIASREKFADALVGGYFGGLIDAPILLVYEKKIRENVDEFLFGLNPDTIYILGGEAVVSKAVADELDGYGIVKSIAAIPNQIVELGKSLKVKVNDKWEMTHDQFAPAFPDYSLTFLYTTGTATMDNKGKSSAVGKGKYNAEVSYSVGGTTVTIPVGGAATGVFVPFEVKDPDAFAKVTEFVLLDDTEGKEVKAVAMGDVADNFVVKPIKAVKVNGKPYPVTSDPIKFEKWVSSSNPKVIDVDAGKLVLKGLGDTTLHFTFKVGTVETDEYLLYVKVNPGPREADSIANENVKAFTYDDKPFNFTAEPFAPIVLDQYKKVIDFVDFVPYLVITKGATQVNRGLASALTNVTGMGTAGNYTVTAYDTGETDNPALAVAANKLGSYTITTVIQGINDKPSFKLVFVDPLDTEDPDGPRLEALDLNALAPVKELHIGVEVYIKGVLLTGDDISQIGLNIASSYKMKSSNVKVATVDETIANADKIKIDVPASNPITGSALMTLYTTDGGSQVIAATLNVTVVNTTPKMTLKFAPGETVLSVAVDGASWKLSDSTELVSPELADYPGTTVNVDDMIASVTFYGEKQPAYAVVKLLPAYGGATYEFPAVLAP